MTWAEWLVVSVTLQYTVAAGIYAWQGNYWTAWIYTGYAFANIGLIKLALRAGGA